MSVCSDKLYVVAPVFNPMRYQSRYRLYREFAHRVKCAGAELMTVEVAFGDRPFEVTEPNNRWHLQLRTNAELFLKENSINLAVARLPADWKYMAWVDADVNFARPDWVEETKQQLQHDPVVQMFSTAYDLGPNNEIYQQFQGFAYCYRNNIPRAKDLRDERYYYGKYWHPGFAHAMTREAFDRLGGLIDFAVLGSADLHMCAALVGHAEWSLPKGIDPGYVESVNIWQERATHFIQGHFGYVEGGLLHYFHGRKKDRKYRDRWDILKDNRYDPEHDLVKDWQGLWQLSDRNPKLHRDCHAYFKSRNEDATEL